MRYPKLQERESSRQMIDSFGGYNHNLRIGAGEFYDMENMTSDLTPILAPRKRRGVYASPEHCRGILAKEQLCYVDGTAFVMGTQRIELNLAETGPKQLVSMGAYVLIFPDKKYVNTADTSDHGSMEASWEAAGDVTFSPCRADGSARNAQYIQEDAPEEPEGGALWVDTSATPHVLKQWAKDSSQWVSIASTYVKIAAPGIGAGFSGFDGVRLEGLSSLGGQLGELEGSAILWDRGEDYLVVTGLLDEAKTVTVSLSVKRVLPVMDFVIESGNRLWGCRYGLDENGEFVNRLYASKLGDFRNWQCFMGLSTDSYYGNLGTDGKFTGAITHMGYPLFFKENCLHKVYGDYPAQFQIQDTVCRGVQEGCDRSLAIVGEVLYYKSRHGVCGYDGSLPVEVSGALGEVPYGAAVAGGHGNKYYISMKNLEEDQYRLFVFDTGKGMWHKEDDLRAEGFASYQGELYCLEHDSGKILSLLGSGDPAEKAVPWMVQTGILGTNMPDRKYISRLNVRMSMDVGGRARFFVQYDSMGGWEHMGTVNVTSLKSFSLPIRPRRCDHLRLRIEGVGEARIYAITETIEKGSDI